MDYHSLFSRPLATRAAEGRPIRVGIIGAGKFGAGLVAQISQMRGMVVAGIADLQLERSRHAYASSRVPVQEVSVVESSAALDDAIRSGRPAITQDGLNLIQADQVDVIVEATGIPDVGAAMAHAAIEHGKHVVMVNVEADVTVGPYLRRLADRAGVVYTLVDGDQPGCTMNMIEWARTLGFEIVAAGRGTVYYADDRAGTPDTVQQRFGFTDEMMARRTINTKMYNSFRDGTKAQVEMTALANAAGLVPDVRGMHEPSVNIADIARVFSLRAEGGILDRHGVVELANTIAADGKTLLPNGLGMGVFVVIRTDHPFTQEDLHAYFVPAGGDGHNYLLYRPYHLVAIEAPVSIAMAALYGCATGAPLPIPTAEVITVAKRDLRAGEILDGGGGYTVNGICEKATVAAQQGLLPLGLSAGARLRQAVPQGAAIAYSMVDLVMDSYVLKLRRLQDAAVRDAAGVGIGA